MLGEPTILHRGETEPAWERYSEATVLASSWREMHFMQPRELNWCCLIQWAAGKLLVEMQATHCLVYVLLQV